jgi:ribose/xylose/arabinose/galactoside ABC-type transport system permease subunit
MTQSLGIRLSRFRRFLPLSATIVLFSVVYALGVISYKGMRDPQVFFTLFITTPFLLISVIGETFVIISGGIDLSVSGVVALTTVASAALIRAGWNPWLVMPLMLLMGMAVGATMGGLITYLKVQPFIATLAGMWFARGMCYIISDAEIRIHNPIYTLLSGTKILIPGLSNVVTQKGDYITILVVVSMAFFAVAIYLAHYTRFGRTIYAMGGNNGANEQSASLMGLPVNRTKVLVYTFNGFCSALAGIAYSIYVGSGHGTHASNGFEMTVIAAVVIGGTMLTGGEGYVFGSLFGVLITALIQTLIQFNGKLSSWWTSISIGALTLVFIGVQSLVANLNTRQLTSRKLINQAKEATQEATTGKTRNRKALLIGSGALIVIVLAVLAFAFVRNATHGPVAGSLTPTASGCQLKLFRQDQAADLIKAGAVITYERNGGIKCVDELYAVYPDGRITGDNGTQEIKNQVTPAEVEKLLSDINNLQWFTDNMYSTSHTPCGACFTYYTSVAYQGLEKTVEAVDGGTDAPPNYWQMTALLSQLLPTFAPAP